MQGHILIINSPEKNTVQYFQRLVRQFRATQQYQDHAIEILTARFTNGLPQSLRELEVVHFGGQCVDPEALEAVNAKFADVIVVLASDEGDAASDGITFDILHRLKDVQVQGRVLAECVDDRNRKRLFSAGANAVVRPIRAYPSMIVRAFTAPGAEQILENLFSYEGDEFQRFEVKVRKPWGDIVCQLVNADIGTPVAYVSKDDQLVANPHAKDKIDASAIIVVVREGNLVTDREVRQALDLSGRDE